MSSQVSQKMDSSADSSPSPNLGHTLLCVCVGNECCCGNKSMSNGQDKWNSDDKNLMQ